MKPTEQQLQEIYEEAVSAECTEKQGEEMPSFDLLCRLDEVGGLAHFIRTMIEMARAGQRQQEPVADVVAWHKEGEERTCDIRWRRHDVAPGPLYAVPQAPEVPAGYVLVPIEPTEAMMLNETSCQHHAWDDPDCSMRQTRRFIWKHMVEAAPKRNQQ